jgi:Na+-driven multidrug efflux pump
VAGDATNIALDPLFIFVFRMGVNGAAIAHVISQYVLIGCDSNALIIPFLICSFLTFKFTANVGI